MIHRRPIILLPLSIPLLSKLANRYLVNFPPFSWFGLTNLIIARPNSEHELNLSREKPSVSVVIPARNETGNIEGIIKRIPDLRNRTELIFVEGDSSDNTYETIEKMMRRFPDRICKLFRQPGKGKGDAPNNTSLVDKHC